MLLTYYHSCASTIRPKGVSDILTGPARGPGGGGLRQNIKKKLQHLRKKIVANLI